MNPIYTGKDVSYIDTKQAQRAAEDAVLDAEQFAVFAGAARPARRTRRPRWTRPGVQLAYGAHHDAITGSESDQVYLDLLTGWRDAWELGRAARDNALALLSSAVDGDVVVWNPLAHKRTDVVTVRSRRPRGRRRRVVDADGAELPALVEHGGRVGQLAGARRAVAGLAGLPAGADGAHRPAGSRRTARDRQRALPAARRPGARRRGVVADRRRAAS